MVIKHEVMSENGGENLVPRGPGDTILPVRLSDTGAGDFNATVTRISGLRRAVVVGISIVLFFAVLSVFFVLPRYVGTGPPATVASPTVAPRPQLSESNVAAALTPEVAAELRRENQTQLEEILALVERLEKHNVRTWAAAEFDAAKADIGLGEQAYREQRYADAREPYAHATDVLKSIDARTGAVVAAAVEDGFAQIEAGNSSAAMKAFNFALAIDPEHEQARQGIARAKTLDQVLALIKEAAGYEELGDLDSALQRYGEALKLDLQAPGAARSVAGINQTKRDAAFRELMSEGLNSFAAKQDAAARTAFERALKLKPGAAEATSALAQVNNRILVNQISSHLSEAAALARAEKWDAAAVEYRKAVSLDAELDGAAASAERALARAELDRQLEATIEKPQRLRDDQVHREALSVLARARAERDPGTRLATQIANLDRAITLARTPVDITLLSDDTTDVTLYKVGPLGRFAHRGLSIIPGQYVIVGKRDGFRDVRVEFEVYPAVPGTTITVQCEQKLAFGS